jgi:uncharacterized protein with PQ loop repeat
VRKKKKISPFILCFVCILLFVIFKIQISNFKIQKKKKKNLENWQRPVMKKKKKKVILFSFCMPFLLFAIFKKKKKIQISNFDFQNSKIQKKKLWDLFFYSILMSRDRAKPLSH